MNRRLNIKRFRRRNWRADKYADQGRPSRHRPKQCLQVEKYKANLRKIDIGHWPEELDYIKAQLQASRTRGEMENIFYYSQMEVWVNSILSHHLREQTTEMPDLPGYTAEEGEGYYYE